MTQTGANCVCMYPLYAHIMCFPNWTKGLALHCIGESVASVAKSAQASSIAIVLVTPAGIQEGFKLCSCNHFWYFNTLGPCILLFR
uniref:Uncharacterized protein n=1 Tax=Aegilops tauschii subsp. strangulata TaxID=200361 RepID=A0A453LKH9_AEGTS